MTNLSILTDKFCGKVNTILKYNFELDEFQKHAINAINRDENVLVTAHTGSGKTVVAQHAIAHAILHNKRAIYTSPIKSLSNEKYKEFKNLFGKQFEEETGLNVSIGILTGDNKINPDGNCLIMTAEILRNALFKQKNDQESIVNNLGCVIMDEVHFINDPDRGKIWEETIIMLDNSVQLVMLSATVDKAENFAEWISKIKVKKINLIPTNKRTIPLRHYIYANNDIHLIMDENNVYHQHTFHAAKKKFDKKNNNNMITEMVEYLEQKDLLQTIFFSFSRMNCETYAKMIIKTLVTHEEQKLIENIWHKHMIQYEKQYSNLNQFMTLKKLIFKGIAFHHSGLLPILKEIVEIIFQQNLIKILFATETFAVGVNMPTRTVVFTELEKYANDNTKQVNKRFLNTAEYKQMAGRAGRRGKDLNGYTILLPLYGYPSENDIKTVLLGKLPQIESKFKLDYQFLLKAIRSIDHSLDTNMTINNFVTKSLYYKETVKLKEILANDKIRLEDEVGKLSVDLDDTEKKIIFELIKLENISQNNIFTLNKQQKNSLDNLKKILRSNNVLKEKYEKYIKQQELNKKFKSVLAEIKSIENFVDNSCQQILSFLVINGYIMNINGGINALSYKDITQKGMMASQINECNGILLTEILLNKILDNLMPEEIVGLMAIFIEDIKNDEFGINDIEATDNLYNALLNVNKIIQSISEIELKIGAHNDEYWKISFSMIDNAYYWAQGCTIQEIQEYCPELYEGNFVRNIIKINNIITDLKSLCKLCGKLELLPTLEKTDSLIMRDIVSVNSLYLL